MDLGVIQTLGTNLSLHSNNNASMKAAKKWCQAKKKQELRNQILKQTLTPSDTTYFFQLEERNQLR